MSIKSLIKQYFCSHKDIMTTTESYNPEQIFIVKSLIQCNTCSKTFARHPHTRCCHVEHIHMQLMYDYWVNKIKNNQ